MIPFLVFTYRSGRGYRLVATDNKVSAAYDVSDLKQMSELELYTFLEAELHRKLQEKIKK